MYRPQISYVIPCHNGGRYLPEAIQSIRSQQGEFEVCSIIVADDRSTDSQTLDLLRTLSHEQGVQIIQSDHIPGPGGARNAGAKQVKTEWLAFLDSDDLLLPGAIQVRVDALNTFADARFIGADFQIWWSGQDCPGKGHQRKDCEGEDYIEQPFFLTRKTPAQILQDAFTSKQPLRLTQPVRAFVDSAIAHSGTVLLKTDLFHRVGGYIESIRYCEDHHLWIKLANEADYVFVPESVMLYRQHDTNMTQIEITPSELYTSALKTLIADPHYMQHHNHIKHRIAELYCNTAMWNRSKGDFMLGIKNAVHGIAWIPTKPNNWKQLIASILHVR